MKHPHAEIIKALADDESLTLWYLDRNTWIQYSKLREHASREHAISFVVFNSQLQFYLGPTPPPRMIETPYGSYPEPLREAPAIGDQVWSINGIGSAYRFYWDDHKEALSSGIVHLTREAAEQQAQVELKRRMAELGWEKS